MTLWESLQSYLLPEGLVSVDKSYQNPVLISAYCCREFQANEQLYANRLLGNVVFYLRKCEVVPGVYKRSPNDLSDNSVDNLIGACYFGYAAADAICRRWNDFGPYFSVQNPSLKKWDQNYYGRFIGLYSYVKACAGFKPNLLERMLWTCSCIWSTYTAKGSSDPLLQSLQNDVMREYCPWAVKQWEKKFNVVGLYKIYFGETHPLYLARMGLLK